MNFDNQGRLSSIVDTNSNQITLAYDDQDPLHHLKTVTDGAYYEPTFYKTDSGDAVADRCRVKKIASCASNGSACDSYSFVYPFLCQKISN